MATLEQVREFRSDRGGNTVSICVGCRHPSWSDYYGAHACRRCTRLFVKAIRERRCYICRTYMGLCLSTNDPTKRCRYCDLERLYRRGLKPIRFGVHDDRWYMLDMIPYINSGVVIDYDPGITAVHYEMGIINRFKYNCFQSYVRWFERNRSENPFINVEGLELLRYDLLSRGMIMAAILECINIHDVLKIEFHYFDPYECLILDNRTWSINILYKVRQFLAKWRENGPNEFDVWMYIVLGIEGTIDFNL
ncbi:uncharacterized protein LOC111633798 [Centruroides sculpturatus]|uniref:uncharacterized protein LOC111633798 n=1 Tax=Centruroides sculpturatus TaxID=218467 RepID=UPI000C6CFF86|nr:uncharacterized protein LOC111633798 [Centruroides sculpturatus]